MPGLSYLADTNILLRLVQPDSPDMERSGTVRIAFGHRERTSSTRRKTWLNSGTFALDRLVGMGSDSL